MDCNHSERTDKEISVHHEITLHRGAVTEKAKYLCHPEISKYALTVFKSQKEYSCKEPYPLSEKRAESYSAIAKFQRSESEENAEYDIETIYYNVGNHRRYGVLHPDKPTLDCKEGKGRRSCPNTDVKILRGKRPDFRRTVKENKPDTKKDPLEDNYGNS